MALPQEVIQEILSRLPVKSLLRFRSVCKLWCSLISDPRFTYLHLERTEGSRKKILLSSPYLLQIVDCQVSPSPSGNDGAVTNLDYPFDTPKVRAKVLGTCDGLICFASMNTNFLLWNPFTGQCRTIPTSESDFYLFHAHGFGYDLANDDYMLVTLFCPPVGENIVRAFSLKANGWRRILQDCCYNPKLSGEGVFLSGSLHYHQVGRFMEQEPRDVILALDLAQEIFREVQQPDYGDNRPLSKKLSVLDGCLCLCECHFQGDTVVWVMKEYGQKAPWTRLFTVACHSGAGYLNCFQPLCFLRTGEVLALINGQGIVKYNWRRGTYKNVMTCDCPYSCVPAVCVESLVSVHWSGGRRLHEVSL